MSDGTQRALTELLEAAEKVLAGLHARIDAAPGTAKPVFNGIADLHDAIGHARTALARSGGASNV